MFIETVKGLATRIERKSLIQCWELLFSHYPISDGTRRTASTVPSTPLLEKL